MFETMTASKTFNKHPKHKAIYHALMESILADEDAMDKDQGLKRRKTGKDTEQSKKASQLEPPKAPLNRSQNLLESLYKQRRQCLRLEILKPPTPDSEWNKGKTVDNKQTQKWLSDLEKAETSSKTFDDLMSTLIDFSAFVMNLLQISNLTQDILVGLTYKLLKGTCRSYVRLEYNMEECYKALTDQLDWNNPEGDRYPFDLSKPLPRVKLGNRQIIQVDYFFKNDLAYLQGESTDRTYTTSSTKTKATKYDLPGIEDMVPNLWSPIKVVYDKHALLVTNVKVNIWYGYSHLEEIEVRRSDQRLYKFMESDFPRLHLNNIKDRILLLVQNRLFNLKGKDIVHLATALRMFTRRIVIQKKVEDLQLGVQRKILMHSDELYKFSDGTLQSVQDILHDMATNLRMGYNKAMPKRRWSHLDKTRSHIMVKEIGRQLRERRLMRSLEKFIGGSHYGEDLRLLQQII
ncbi:hypothetical protein Tco_1241619 [Tanacetum coccineum]